MNREKLFRLVGVTYELKDNSIVFSSANENSKVYFPVEKQNLNEQIDSFSIDFFMSNPQLQKELIKKLNVN